MHLPFQEKMHVQEAAAGLLLRGEANIGSYKRKTNRAFKDATFETAPGYLTKRCLQNYWNEH
jgi:hypothetical protein